MSNKIYILLFLIGFSVAVGCVNEEDPISPLIERLGPHLFIRGKVILENQTNPAHCPVVFDNFLIGTITDSTGNYEIFIPDSLAKLTGTFRIYYYLYDYDLDSLSVRIENGKVVWGQEDVNDEGFLKTVTLKQIISLEVTSDKSQYMVGENITLSINLTNKSKRIIWLITSTILETYIYDINIDTVADYISGWDPTADNPHIDPGESYNRKLSISGRPKREEGYVIPVLALNQGYKIPATIVDYLWQQRTQWEAYFSNGGIFFVFLMDPKNLSFPLIKVIQN